MTQYVLCAQRFNGDSIGRIRMRDAGHDETDGARLRERYGPWAVIAGASEGMGAEYARMLAEQGLNCVLVSRRQAVLDKLAAGLESEHGIRTRAIGDPMDPTSVFGPLVSERQRARVEGYIRIGQEQGAKVVVVGGGRPDGLTTGYYVEPTVFRNVGPSRSQRTP
jgi:hypothetical protein